MEHNINLDIANDRDIRNNWNLLLSNISASGKQPEWNMSNVKTSSNCILIHYAMYCYRSIYNVKTDCMY